MTKTGVPKSGVPKTGVPKTGVPKTGVPKTIVPKTIVLTGASDGIGAAAAENLVAAGHRVLVVGRSPEKTRAVADRLGVAYAVADYTRLEEVRRLADQIRATYPDLDVLGNNAGAQFSHASLTEDGFERTFQVNYLAPFLLTWLLRDLLVARHGAVVATASAAARLFGRLDLEDLTGVRHFSSSRAYGPFRAYGNAKVATVLFTRALHHRYHDDGLSAVAVSPGIVATNFGFDMGPLYDLAFRSALGRLFSSPEAGGELLAGFLAGTPGQDWRSGQLYGTRHTVVRTNPQAYDPALELVVWTRTLELLDLTE